MHGHSAQCSDLRLLCCGAWTSHWGGFPGCRAQALGCVGVSSCGAPAQELWLMGLVALSCVWGPPGPGMEPVSPALAGGFFTTEPPGKPLPLLS